MAQASLACALSFIMGSKLIWILASIGFGCLTGLIYALICQVKQRKGFLRRLIVWSALYSLGALVLCRLLWALFAG